MSVKEYSTSQGEPALVITPAGSNRAIRFESQPDGFGMIWPTTLDAVTALRQALAVLPDREPEDETTIIDASGEPRTYPALELFEQLEQSSDVVLVDVELGTAAVAWAASTDADGQVDAQMSFGDDYYHADQVRSMLEGTDAMPALEDRDGEDLDLVRILRAAEYALRAHLPPDAAT